MDILAIEDREHGDALEFTRVTNQQFVQIWELTKQHCRLQASPESDNFSWMARH